MPINKKINRLLQYRSVLLRLQDLGFGTVFSYTLGKEVGVTAEQVRKDFSKFGIKGNKKGGYNINELIHTLGDIFHKDHLHKVILIGIGNIGTAILNYKGFRENMIEIVAGFDIDPVKYKKKYTVPVYPMEKIDEVINEYGVKTAIIAVPGIAAQEVCSRLTNAGINSILNISPAVLKVPPGVIIQNIQIGNALESLIYQTINLDE
jgi:redox-sensing transcriptional repressor